MIVTFAITNIRKIGGCMDEYFVTVFPKDKTELPQDYLTYKEAKESADERYGEGNYTIESPFE